MVMPSAVYSFSLSIARTSLKNKHVTVTVICQIWT